MKGNFKKSDDFDIRYSSFKITLLKINDEHFSLIKEKKNAYYSIQVWLFVGLVNVLEILLKLAFIRKHH